MNNQLELEQDLVRVYIPMISRLASQLQDKGYDTPYLQRAFATPFHGNKMLAITITLEDLPKSLDEEESK